MDYLLGVSDMSQPAPRRLGVRAGCLTLALIVVALPARAQDPDRPRVLPGAAAVPADVAARLALESASADTFEHETLTNALSARIGAALAVEPESASPPSEDVVTARSAALQALLGETVAFVGTAGGEGGASVRHGGVAVALAGPGAEAPLPRADAARRFDAVLDSLLGAAPWKVKVLRSERRDDAELMLLVKFAPRPTEAALEDGARVQRGGLARIRFTWRRAPDSDALDPRAWSIARLEVVEVERTAARRGFDDVTATVLAASPESRAQLVPSIAALGLGLDAQLGVGFLGHHGLAVGDVNSDGIDDIYLCQPGGLPDQLWVRRADGTAVDVAAALGLDLLDTSSSALFVDFDNDGDQDLVRSTSTELIVHVNQGGGAFPVAFALDVAGATSLAAADVDLDGRVDLFLCTYGSPYTGGGLPLPFHDARNGTKNLLFANRSTGADALAFEDVTDAAGLAGPDQRFSFAASFEDFDGDGDPDLYVANDFGRNHLWRNERAPDAPFRFVNVAPDLGVEDIASGMGVTWADFDLDGRSDLYVSNMFSSAGNRIAYDRRFQPSASDEARDAYRRHAAGNSLFLARDGGFQYTGEASLGLWAWGGLAFELDGDGRPDLYVPNGFITGTNPDDL